MSSKSYTLTELMIFVFSLGFLLFFFVNSNSEKEVWVPFIFGLFLFLSCYFILKKAQKTPRVENDFSLVFEGSSLEAYEVKSLLAEHNILSFVADGSHSPFASSFFLFEANSKVLIAKEFLPEAKKILKQHDISWLDETEEENQSPLE